ncbi:MAG TPA: hypothetical protein VGR71_11655 [Nitrospira sp.]|nr:hypothetical protein [Nitrospira sp.]
MDFVIVKSKDVYMIGFYSLAHPRVMHVFEVQENCFKTEAAAQKAVDEIVGKPQTAQEVA